MLKAKNKKYWNISTPTSWRENMEERCPIWQKHNIGHQKAQKRLMTVEWKGWRNHQITTQFSTMKNSLMSRMITATKADAAGAVIVTYTDTYLHILITLTFSTPRSLSENCTWALICSTAPKTSLSWGWHARCRGRRYIFWVFPWFRHVCGSQRWECSDLVLMWLPLVCWLISNFPH